MSLAYLPVPTDLTEVSKAPFKRLKMKHRRIIALHLQAHSNVAIANLVGCNPSYVSEVLNNPTVQPVLERCYEEYEKQCRALFPAAIQTIAKFLKSDEGATGLRAAELALKVNRKFDTRPEDRQTAEDVIERVLEKINPDGSRLRLAERRVSFLRPQVEEEEVVDV